MLVRAEEELVDELELDARIVLVLFELEVDVLLAEEVVLDSVVDDTVAATPGVLEDSLLLASTDRTSPFSAAKISFACCNSLKTCT